MVKLLCVLPPGEPFTEKIILATARGNQKTKTSKTKNITSLLDHNGQTALSVAAR